MTINQIKMLTTSCKNYKSLKQCVIEKKGSIKQQKAEGNKLNYEFLLSENGNRGRRQKESDGKKFLRCKWVMMSNT